MQDEQRWPRSTSVDAWMSELHAYIVEIAYLVGQGVPVWEGPLFQVILDFVRSRPRGHVSVSTADLEMIAARIERSAGTGQASDMHSYAAQSRTQMGARLQQRARTYASNPEVYRAGIRESYIPACRPRR